MIYHNLSIRSKDGTFMEIFKAPQEGAEQYINKNREARWIKSYKEVSGEVHSLKIDNVDFGAGEFEMLKLSLNKDGEAWIIGIPIMDTRGVSDWAIQLGHYVDQINIGDDIALSLNWKEKDKSEKWLKKILFVKKEGQSLKHTYTKEEIPQWEKKKVKDKITKKEREEWDNSDFQAFFYDVLTKNAERLQPVGRSNEPAPVESGAEDDTDIDSLPF